MRLSDLDWKLRKSVQSVQSAFHLQLALYFMAPGHEAHKIVARIQDKQYERVIRLFKHAAKDEPALKGQHEYCAITFLGMIEQWAAISLSGHVRLDSNLVHYTVHQFLYGIYSSKPEKLF